MDGGYQSLKASTEDEIDAALATLVRLHAAALVVTADWFFDSRREQLVDLAARQTIPAIYEWREFAEVGGLMSYGPSLTDTIPPRRCLCGPDSRRCPAH